MNLGQTTRWVRAAALAGGWLCVALPCLAGDSLLNKRVSVDYQDIPLTEVFADLEGKTGLRITAAEGLLQDQDHVTYAAKEQEAGRVLTRILYPRGLRIEPRGAASVSVAKRSGLDEFRVKSEPPFEFAEKPTVTREGDKVTVRFETRAFCDATVAIEDAEGRIVRHLASGVLGENAPEPFQWNTKKQALVWDGKDDKEEYVDDKDRLTVRVSLGLRPRFERTLYWSPYKRIAQMAPVMAATEDGVAVAEGDGVDSVRLYDHEGRYLRTIYPFPAATLNEVKGLEWTDLPHGQRIPMKNRWYGQTLLTSGDSALTKGPAGGMGRGVSGIGARGIRLALADYRLNRVTTTGTTWGGGLEGGECGISPGYKRVTVSDYQTLENFQIGPTSVALSPDGKWIYLAGYSYRCGLYTYSVEGNLGYDTLHGVARMPADGRGGMEPFLGSLRIRHDYGSEPGQFINAASVDCDSKGRLYVADFMNDRVQIFSPDGAFLKSLDVAKPAVVRVHRRNDEIYVFSWLIPSRLLIERLQDRGRAFLAPTLTRFGPFDDPKVIRKYALPMLPRLPWGGGQPDGLWMTGEIDSWTDPPTIWLGRECRNDAELANVHPGDGGQRTRWETAGIKVLREAGGELEEIRDFGRETLRQAVRAKPAVNAIQRLVANPATGKLYVGEPDSGPTGKAFCSLLEIDPETGTIGVVELPFNPMEYAFDLEGNIYLRNTDMIARYSFPSLSEIPWDYGTARRQLGADGGIGGRVTSVKGGLEMPAKWPVCYHQGGIGVSPTGYVVAACGYRSQGLGVGARKWQLRSVSDATAAAGKPYRAALFPGRASNSLTPCIHVWDRHGKVVFEDAVPGVAQVDGVEIDRDLNLYFMHTPRRVVDGQPYFNVTSSTLMKTRPRAVKVLSSNSADIPMSDETRPKRGPDLNRVPEGNIWVEGGGEWFYGGVGFAAFNAHNYCGCWFSRFALDYFGRSIAPEPYQFSVAIVDLNGNLILRMGRCGNVDDGVPLASEGRGTSGTADGQPRSIGGDEVALFHACYVATHTDRRIFISDVGNGRILSVKLGYHAEETIALKDVPEHGGR